jgi:hypothetical protein
MDAAQERGPASGGHQVGGGAKAPTNREDKMPREPVWLRDHAHPHTHRYPEHEHGEDPSEEALKLEHDVLFASVNIDDDFDQGPEANRAVDETGAPGEWEVPRLDQDADEADGLTAKGKPSDGEVAQTGFGDEVINIEDEEGEKFLALLDERQQIKALASRFNEVNADIKKQVANRGLNTGKAVRIRVGAHILNLSDKSADKEVEAKTREGSQRLGIVHPE